MSVFGEAPWPKIEILPVIPLEALVTFSKGNSFSLDRKINHISKKRLSKLGLCVQYQDWPHGVGSAQTPTHSNDVVVVVVGFLLFLLATDPQQRAFSLPATSGLF